MDDWLLVAILLASWPLNAFLIFKLLQLGCESHRGELTL